MATKVAAMIITSMNACCSYIFSGHSIDQDGPVSQVLGGRNYQNPRCFESGTSLLSAGGPVDQWEFNLRSV